MKIERIKFCKICGKECNKLFDGMCKKHYSQIKTYGKIINANQRTVFDPNELRVYEKLGGNNYIHVLAKKMEQFEIIHTDILK